MHALNVADDERLVLHRQSFGQVRVVPKRIVAVADIDDRRDEGEMIFGSDRAHPRDVCRIPLLRAAEGGLQE